MSERHLLFIAPVDAVSAVFQPLKDSGYILGMNEKLDDALAFIKQCKPELIFARPSLLNGFRVEELFNIAEKETNFPPIVVISDRPNPDEAEKMLNLGAKDYWFEPLDVNKINVLCQQTTQPKVAVPEKTTLGGHKPKPEFHIVGKSEAIQKALALAKQVAGPKATVLISGESGTGKEMFARYLHAMSNRADGPFIAVNCAALPENLLESELFGHEKGAFTGAIAKKPGKFELADGGTILLDEISEMALALQAKLLRVIQEKKVDRVGGTETISVNVRILATTNRNLEGWVKEGKFREDLFFRLNTIPLRLPSLRERGDDVFEIARFFIDMYVKEYEVAPTMLSSEAMTWLREYKFPGNVRELQNLMERAVLLANGQPISPKHFLLEDQEWPLFEDNKEEEMPKTESSSSVETQANNFEVTSISNVSSKSLSAGPVIPLHEMERIMIQKGLQATAGNRTQAAELLGISVRTLRNKLNEYRNIGNPID